jgi:hypothetical protein
LGRSPGSELNSHKKHKKSQKGGIETRQWERESHAASRP